MTDANGGGYAPEVVERTPLDLVAISENFYVLVLGGMLAVVVAADTAALALLPLRAAHGAVPVTGLVFGGVTLIAAAVALARSTDTYKLLRGRRLAQLVLVAFAASLVSLIFPLRSQLWWPACALLMVLAVVVSLREVISAGVVVLSCNLLAHVVNGDLHHTPAVSIVGLWVGFLFWSTLVRTAVDQLVCHLLRRARITPAVPAEPSDARPNAGRANDRRPGDGQPGDTARAGADRTGRDDHPVAVRTDSQPPAHRPAENGGLDRLTSRELEVLALLVDGLQQQEIAEALSISTRQVRRHVASACERTGVRNDNQLATLAVRVGLFRSRVTI